jgi:hypothetical protein
VVARVTPHASVLGSGTLAVAAELEAARPVLQRAAHQKSAGELLNEDETLVFDRGPAPDERAERTWASSFESSAPVSSRSSGPRASSSEAAAAAAQAGCEAAWMTTQPLAAPRRSRIRLGRREESSTS